MNQKWWGQEAPTGRISHRRLVQSLSLHLLPVVPLRETPRVYRGVALGDLVEVLQAPANVRQSLNLPFVQALVHVTHVHVPRTPDLCHRLRGKDPAKALRCGDSGLQSPFG